MPWTRDIPQKEGWYWYRDECTPDTIVEVYQDADGQWFAVGTEMPCQAIMDLIGERDEDDNLVREECEWQPVQPPTE